MSLQLMAAPAVIARAVRDAFSAIADASISAVRYLQNLVQRRRPESASTASMHATVATPQKPAATSSAKSRAGLDSNSFSAKDGMNKAPHDGVVMHAAKKTAGSTTGASTGVTVHVDSKAQNSAQDYSLVIKKGEQSSKVMDIGKLVLDANKCFTDLVKERHNDVTTNSFLRGKHDAMGEVQKCLAERGQPFVEALTSKVTQGLGHLAFPKDANFESDIAAYKFIGKVFEGMDPSVLDADVVRILREMGTHMRTELARAKEVNPEWASEKLGDLPDKAHVRFAADRLLLRSVGPLSVKNAQQFEQAARAAVKDEAEKTRKAAENAAAASATSQKAAATRLLQVCTGSASYTTRVPEKYLIRLEDGTQALNGLGLELTKPARDALADAHLSFSKFCDLIAPTLQDNKHAT